MENKKLAKIIIPILMVCIIGGIWFFQSSGNNTENEVESDKKFPLTVTSVDLDALSKHELPIIIDFGADECVPCKEMAPVLETLNDEMQDKAIIQFVDVWKNPEAIEEFPVQVIPTQFFVNADGTPYVPNSDIASVIPFYLHKDPLTQEHLYTFHPGGLTEENLRVILKDMGVE